MCIPEENLLIGKNEAGYLLRFYIYKKKSKFLTIKFFMTFSTDTPRLHHIFEIYTLKFFKSKIHSVVPCLPHNTVNVKNACNFREKEEKIRKHKQ